MPTEAFFKLDPQKKSVLLESAVAEFSALPFEKVSIFKIAQNAGVSRSGFYYYFKDKEDIYKYLLDQIKDSFMEELGREGKKCDIFSFTKKIFHWIASLKGTSRAAFIEQVVSNIKPQDTKEFFDRMEACSAEKHFEYLCDLENLNISTQKDLMGLTCLLISSTMYSLQRYFIDEETIAAAEERLELLLEMIKHGVLK